MSLVTIVRVAALSLLVASLGAWAQTQPLNDTGIGVSGHGVVGNAATCVIDADHPEGQDCRYGRDAAAAAGTLEKLGGGDAGFDYTRVCNSGELAGEGSCPADPVLGSGADDWACTLDNVTGLIWEVKADAGLRSMDHTYTWYDSSSPGETPGTADGGNCEIAGHCDTEHYVADVNATNLCGFNDWRMPASEELQSLVHFGRTDLAIDTAYFPNTTPEMFWAGTPFSASFNSTAWIVNFGSGFSDNQEARSTAGKVRVVRGELAGGSAQPTPMINVQICIPFLLPVKPDAIYEVHGDGTVTDTVTGLMWKQCVEGLTGSDCGTGSANSMTWAEALAHAGSHVFAGYDDWRLPNIKEMESLTETCTRIPAINKNVFPNTPDGRFMWSSTPMVMSYGIGGAWALYSEVGRVIVVGRTTPYLVRLVRSGTTFDATDFLFEDGFEAPAP